MSKELLKKIFSGPSNVSTNDTDTDTDSDSYSVRSNVSTNDTDPDSYSDDDFEQDDGVNLEQVIKKLNRKNRYIIKMLGPRNNLLLDTKEQLNDTVFKLRDIANELAKNIAEINKLDINSSPIKNIGGSHKKIRTKRKRRKRKRFTKSLY